MFGIVLKFHSQTTSVEGVITIPVIILKQHAACCFIGLTMIDIVLKFHDQTPSVVKVITIPVIIQKRSVTYLFIGRSNNN